MSQSTCPNGHLSNDPDWCDTCGARLGAAPSDPNAAAGASPAAVPSPPAAPHGSSGSTGSSPMGSVPCPHCDAPNLSDALFCEDCGYDFTTGQAPDPVPTGTVSVTGSTPAPSTGPAATVAAAADPSGVVVPAGPSGWIVIVEVDPKWFELKGTLADQPCPRPSSSTIPLGLAVVRIGRSSQSRGIHPEIAMDSDTAVSRQHAQLIAASSTGDSTAPADAFAAVDLGSTNGTFVVKAGAEPNADIQPIDPGVATLLADGDRVYLGAWSRLTIRNTGA
ncbi:MAG: FHA domain-containing protein [Ilumatobacteraceae bacterium]